MRRILFRHPWRDLGLESLSCEGPDGRLIGFLGVLPRRMKAGNRPLTMAVSHHYMVDPEHRGTLAGLSLMKSFLGGRQDLSLCETQETVRRIWESLGGSSSLLYSFHWTRYLRPAAYLIHRVGERLPRFLASGLAFGAGLADASVVRSSPLRIAEPNTTRSELRPGDLLPHVQASSERCFLRPDYGNEDLAWLIDLLAHKTERGQFRVRLVRGSGGEVAGHYAYYVNREGAGEVVQVGARDGHMEKVIADLFHDAWTLGVPALAGRLDPGYAEELSARHAIFRRRGSRLMFSTSSREVERAIQAGSAYLTRFETEWWIPYQDDPRP